MRMLCKTLITFNVRPTESSQSHRKPLCLSRRQHFISVPMIIRPIVVEGAVHLLGRQPARSHAFAIPITVSDIYSSILLQISSPTLSVEAVKLLVGVSHNTSISGDSILHLYKGPSMYCSTTGTTTSRLLHGRPLLHWQCDLALAPQQRCMPLYVRLPYRPTPSLARLCQPSAPPPFPKV